MTIDRAQKFLPRRHSKIAAAVMAFILLLPATALAEEFAADVDQFCSTFFDANAFGNIDRRDDGLVCSVRTTGGLGLLHHKVTGEMVCAAQHQTTRFRREGQQLVCISGQPAAAERTVDLEQHCKDAYGADAFLNENRVTGQPMCTVRTDGGLGLLHHIIDAPSLCGGGSAQVEAGTVRCGGGSAAGAGDNSPANNAVLEPSGIDGNSAASQGTSDAGSDGKSFNLRRLCAIVFQGAHATSISATVTRDSGDRPICNVRFSDEPDVRLHTFDLASICGGGPVRFDVENLYCGEQAIARDNVMDAGGTGNLDGLAVTPGHLADCGIQSDGYLWSIDESGISDPLASGLDGARWDGLGATRSCPGLAGGRVLDFQTYCELRPNRSSSDGGFLHLETTPAGRPVCYGGTRAEFLALSTYQSNSTDNIRLDGACMDLYLNTTGRNRTADQIRRAEDTVVVVKYEVLEGSAECFYMKLLKFREMFEVIPITIRFVRAENGSFKEIVDDLAYFEPIYVEIELGREASSGNRDVTVNVSGHSTTLTARRVAPMLFRTPDPFMLAPDQAAPIVRP